MLSKMQYGFVAKPHRWKKTIGLGPHTAHHGADRQTAGLVCFAGQTVSSVVGVAGLHGSLPMPHARLSGLEVFRNNIGENIFSVEKIFLDDSALLVSLYTGTHR